MLGETKLSFELYWQEFPGDLTPCAQCNLMLHETMFIFVLQVVEKSGSRNFAESDAKLCKPCYELVKGKI